MRELVTLIGRHAPSDGMHATALPQVDLFRASNVAEPIHAVYEPSLCIVAQGRKQSMVGGKVYVYDAAKYLVISADIPIVSQHIDATPEHPFLCLRLRLDPAIIGELIVEKSPARTVHEEPGPALVVSSLTSELLDGAVRLLRLLDAPQDMRALGPLIEREIIYRLLNGEQTSKLGQIAFAESKLQQVNRAIAWIKRNFREPFRIDAAAAEAGMSPSALHLHFKAITRLSPLQYQKQLRLQEARRLMLAQSVDAAAAAFLVGYESPSQFSREYRRLFGMPPARDGRRLRRNSQVLEEV